MATDEPTATPSVPDVRRHFLYPDRCLSVHAGVFRCELDTGHTGNHRLKRTLWRDEMVTDEPDGLTPKREEQLRELAEMSGPDSAMAHAVAEIDRLRRDLEEVQQERDRLRTLAADATEYRVHLPENGGTTLLIKRQSGVTGGVGWAVSVPGYGGGRAWTTEGWQDSISALSVDRLFCWPSAEVARDEARSALTEGA